MGMRMAGAKALRLELIVHSEGVRGGAGRGEIDAQVGDKAEASFCKTLRVG